MTRRAFFAMGLALLPVGCRPNSVEDPASTGGAPTSGSGAPTTGGSSMTQPPPDAGGPRISCLPASLAFGDVVAYESGTLSVVCTNLGASGSVPGLIIDPPLASPRVFTTEFDPSDFPNPSAGLEPGQSARIFVRYRPTTTSTDQGVLTIHNNTGDDARIPLSGQGLPARPCQFTFYPQFLDFGSVQVGNTSPPSSFEIQNTGPGLCFVGSLTVTEDATSSFHILSTSLALDPDTGVYALYPDAGPLADLTVTVDFAPTTSADPLTAGVPFSVSDAAGNTNPVAVELSGAAPVPDESQCLDIGAEGILSQAIWPVDGGGTLCSVASRTITFLDNCVAYVAILSMTLVSTSGDTEPQFTITGPELPLTVQGLGAVYQVAFNPTSAGQHSAQLTVAHNSQHSSAEIDSTIMLTGQTVPPPSETDTFVATSALSYSLANTPLFASGISVTLSGTRVDQLDGPNQPDWTYDATANAIDFTFRVDLKEGDAIAVTYPLGCK